MRKLATMAVLGVLAFAGISFATTPTQYMGPVYMDWTLGGQSTGTVSQGPYRLCNSILLDTFTSAHGQFKDTWVLKKPMYDVVLFNVTQTMQVGCWIGPGGAIEYCVPKDSTGLFIPGRVDTIFTYRVAADTAGSNVYFATGRIKRRDTAREQW